MRLAPSFHRSTLLSTNIKPTSSAVALPTVLRRASLAPLLEGRGRPSLDSADGPLQLALLLAVERGKGSDSFWAPYIHALPPKAPNAWQMDEPTLKAAIASYGKPLPAVGDCSTRS